MKSSRIILALMLVAIMVSVICVSVSAATYLDSLEAVNGATVNLDGVNDATVTVAVAGTGAMNVYGIEGTWTLADVENSGKISLTALGSDVMTFTGMNSADLTTGIVRWTDDTFSAPAVLAAGTKMLTATYTVAKDTPAGTYTVTYTSQCLAADDFNNDTTAKVFTFTITVVAHEHVSNAAHPCLAGVCACGQEMPATAEHGYNNDCDKNCKTCGTETRPAADHAYNYDCDKKCKYCGTETRPNAEHSYFYACDPVCQLCYELTNPSAAHQMTHHEAKKGTDCETWDGNVEYWQCDHCGGCWDNANGMYAPINGRTAAKGDHAYNYDCDKKCKTCGDETRPTAEHSYFYACDPVCQLCYELTNPSAAHQMTHHEAKKGTDCETWDGNVEYWQCDHCGGCWDNANGMYAPINGRTAAKGDHVYDNACDFDCNVCGEFRDAPHNLTTHVVEKVPANCQEEGWPEHWICEDCDNYFLHADGTGATNPAWIKYYGDHTRPADAADCATVTCEVCGEDSYGSAPCDRGDAPACTDATCVNCGGTAYGYGHDYNDGSEETPLPLCQPGDCIYCGEHFEKLFDCENGSYAPCTVDGECVYGCGKEFPADGNHDFGEGVTACDGGLCFICWETIDAADHEYENACDKNCSVCGNETNPDADHAYNYACDTHCKHCGEETNPDAEHSVKHVDPVVPTECGGMGNVEYWYCEHCGCVWVNEELTQVSNRMSVVVFKDHELTHVEAKPATEEADGNIEHWYCEACGKYFADEYGNDELTEEEVVVTYVPPTADASTLIPAVVLALLAATGVALLVTKKDLLK